MFQTHAVAWIYSQKTAVSAPIHEEMCAGINPFGGRGNFSEALLNSKGTKGKDADFGCKPTLSLQLLHLNVLKFFVAAPGVSRPILLAPGLLWTAEQCTRSAPRAEPLFYISITNCWYCSLISVSKMPCQASQGAHQCPLDSFSPWASASCWCNYRCREMQN